MGIKRGMTVNLTLNKEGEVVIYRAQGSAKRMADCFEAARGKADVKWLTKDLTALLRGEI
jgi:hypothetical protein